MLSTVASLLLCPLTNCVITGKPAQDSPPLCSSQGHHRPSDGSANPISVTGVGGSVPHPHPGLSSSEKTPGTSTESTSTQHKSPSHTEQTHRPARPPPPMHIKPHPPAPVAHHDREDISSSRRGSHNTLREEGTHLSTDRAGISRQSPKPSRPPPPKVSTQDVSHPPSRPPRPSRPSLPPARARSATDTTSTRSSLLSHNTAASRRGTLTSEPPPPEYTSLYPDRTS